MADHTAPPAFGQDVSFIREKQLFRLRAAAIILHKEQVLMVKNA